MSDAQLAVLPSPPAIGVGTFRKRLNLTGAQSMMIDIMNECIAQGRSFSVDDAICCWSYASNTWECGIRGYDKDLGQFIIMDVYDPRVQSIVEKKASQWLATNIGVCVMKGALIAVPTINIRLNG